MKKQGKLALANAAITDAIQKTEQMIVSPNGEYEKCSARTEEALDRLNSKMASVLKR